MSTILNVLIGVLAVGAAVFLNYPAPPQSPIVYQWQSPGKFMQYKEKNIFYKDELGNGTGTVLCLHGFPTSSFDWYKLWPALKRKFGRVVALDFLGLGFSDKPRFHKYSIFEQASIVEELLQTLQTNKVHILAHDYGDTVAQELIARHLDAAEEKKNYVNVMSLCLLNGGIFPAKHHPRLMQRILVLPLVGTILSKFINYYVFRNALGEVFGPETWPTTAEFRDFWGIIRHNDGYRVLGSLLSYLEERKTNEERWVGGLQKTVLPVHVIYGPADPVNPPEFIEYYRAVIPKPSMTVLPENIGHYPQLEAPEATADAYISFLETISS
ncbi:mesoderm-specific transcript protein-like [Limulus polyphemus]|uniref:Mesoderm-specific transcript protein-like n=1 Tax=Limulus polyphemus TaxID=6850 RepID=A0ABM1BFK2_LIMPO|nr:mesoderm-specific transcript protein-like [Limulus polyphemus]XP_022249302.1 mesoderm-specific transcript protein-like [Limulus polyphemus]